MVEMYFLIELLMKFQLYFRTVFTVKPNPAAVPSELRSKTF